MVRPLLKIGSIVAFVALLVAYFWWSMRVPPPRERDRVTHREGVFSIVPPRGWEVAFNYIPTADFIDALELRAPSVKARDLRIFLGRMRRAPDLSRIQSRDRQIDTQFQGRPAHVFTGRTRHEHYWRAVFQRGGQWYELVFWSPYEQDIPASGWWAYLQSFQAREAPSTAPATSDSLSL